MEYSTAPSPGGDQPAGSQPNGPWPGSPQQPHGWTAPPPGQYPQPYVPGGYPQQMSAQASSNGMAVASLVLGICSIVLCWWGLATLAA
jgi:hypothetical protein